MSKAVAKVEEAQVPAVVAPVGEDKLISLIEKVAFGPNANMEQVERMLAMVERERAQKAERDFNDAMAKAQAEMRPVAADAENSQTKSRYATYAALDRVLRPIYTKHGFAPSFNTGDGAPEGYVRVVCDLTNSGHTRRYKIDMPSDGMGAKGAAVMTKTHATGSAVQYGMRYLLKMMFNVAVGEADDDGNAAGMVDTIDAEQLDALQKKIGEVEANEQRFCAYMKVKTLGAIRASDYKRAIDALDAKARASI